MSEQRAAPWLSKTSAPASAFFSCVALLARYRLLRRIALEVWIGGPLGAHLMHDAERPHGRLADGHAFRLVERGSECSIGPVGTVEAAARRPSLHPGEARGGQGGRDGGRPARRPGIDKPSRPLTR
jgi:hypothetical protein